MQSVGSIKIICKGGCAVTADGSVCIPRGFCSQSCSHCFCTVLGMSLEMVNSSSEVVCPLLQE